MARRRSRAVALLRGRRRSRRARAIRRRSLRRRNPLWLARMRSGRVKFIGLPPGRLLHRRRKGRGRGRWHNNPRRRSYRRNAVVPVSWNPRRRRAHRRYRRNSPVLPYAWNPAGAVSGVLGKAQSFIDVRFWTDVALPAVGGFIGTKTVGGMIYGAIGKAVSIPTGIVDNIARIGSDVVAASVLSWGVGRFIGRPQGEKVFLGGVVAIAHSVLKALIGGTEIAKTIGLDGLGDDATARLKEAVARRVEAEMSGLYGVGAYLTAQDLRPQMAGMGAYLTAQDMRPQMMGDDALRMLPNYSALPTAQVADYEVARTETSL